MLKFNMKVFAFNVNLRRMILKKKQKKTKKREWKIARIAGADIGSEKTRTRKRNREECACYEWGGELARITQISVTDLHVR